MKPASHLIVWDKKGAVLHVTSSYESAQSTEGATRILEVRADGCTIAAWIFDHTQWDKVSHEDFAIELMEARVQVILAGKRALTGDVVNYPKHSLEEEILASWKARWMWKP